MSTTTAELPASPTDAVACTVPAGQDRWQLSLLVDDMHCGACVHRIEHALTAASGVEAARANLTERKLSLAWHGQRNQADHWVSVLQQLGYHAQPFDPKLLSNQEAAETRALLRALAVAGFAAGNVMLLSISIWAGHSQGMAEVTRTMFHWLSGLIAMPAITYSGIPFFRSAFTALRNRSLNMDVPISLAIILATLVSVVETWARGQHAYFDSAIALVFFLLLGRYLERRARAQARTAAARQLTLRAQMVAVLDDSGQLRNIPPHAVQIGMTAWVAPGQQIGVDGTVIDGDSEVDVSVISGESAPVRVGPGDRVFAGCLNSTGALRLRIDRIGEQTLLAEIANLMQAAEQRKAKYVERAAQIVRLYAPLVHVLAAAAFIGWLGFGGATWREAALIAVAVLIITCPCALGLAVPVAQTIAVGRLLRTGVLIKSATALERLANVDTVIFDKTGTLTTGTPTLINDQNRPTDLRVAAELAAASKHPLAQALTRSVPEIRPASGVREQPGSGLELGTAAGTTRLGNRAWCGVQSDDPPSSMELWLKQPNREPVRFQFHDPLRDDAISVVQTLHDRGYQLRILSGDNAESVGAAARELNIDQWQGDLKPPDKLQELERLAAQGSTTLMVGDGINDAPALAAASVSLSPTTATDLSQTAADVVFQGAKLAPVLESLTVAKRANRLIHQNFALAIAYNVCAVPLAVAGWVTPLIAAIAMSTSSVLVVLNSIRLGRGTIAR